MLLEADKKGYTNKCSNIDIITKTSNVSFERNQVDLNIKSSIKNFKTGLVYIFENWFVQSFQTPIGFCNSKYIIYIYYI